MLSSLVRFTDDSAGLEKGLRGLQNLATIGLGLAQTVEEVQFWAKSRSQFALGRRYFRLLKWHPCWSNALDSLDSAAEKRRAPLGTALEVAKWSFLGLYFFLEMLTISDAMGLTEYDWSPKVQREANRSWFIALVFSILLSLYELCVTDIPTRKDSGNRKTSAMPNEKKTDTPSERTMNDSNDKALKGDLDSKRDSDVKLSSIVKNQTPGSPSSKIYAQLVIDSCDLFLPGAAVGWLPVSTLFVGIFGTISTTVAGQQIWKRVQNAAH